MGRFGDWAKGPWRETIRVKVAYEGPEDPGSSRAEIIVLVPRASLNYGRDAVDKAQRDLKNAGRTSVRILSTEVEGQVPFIWAGESW